jgi:hypothetical protein
MKLILKCSSHEFSPDDIEWAFITLDEPLIARALKRRRILLHAKAQDDQIYELYFWDATSDFFSLSPDPDEDDLLNRKEDLETTLQDHEGQSINWTCADLYRVSDETAIPDAYLRAVECS